MTRRLSGMIDTAEQVKKSKSQVKRELQALKDLGQKLVMLPEKSLKKIPMTDELRESVLEAKQLKREALRRQIQHIGVLMRGEDVGAIRHAMVDITQPHVDKIRAFHEIEQWRDALLAGNDALLDSLCQRFPKADCRHLQLLVEKARMESNRNKSTKSARALFRYLSDLQQRQ